MTRLHDETLSLSERSAKAQQCDNVQALVTIHTNSAKSSQIQGIETFCHQPHLFRTMLYKGDHSFKPVIGSVYNDIDVKSYQFARAVHTNILKYAQRENRAVVDRKIKHQVSQLLLNSTAPSILVELGFLTHPQEKVLLQQDSYQMLLAQGIVEGIEEFFRSSFV